MTAQTPDRPNLPDDLDQAYARAHALADEGRAPAASVRASVLAAALQVAASAASPVGVEPEARPTLTPVAAPVSEVARGRGWARNLSSWRLRSGAALCAALIVAFGAWRFDARHRLDAGTQVAAADIQVMEAKVVGAAPADPPPPKGLPMPRMLPMASPAQPPVELAAAPAPVPADLPLPARAAARDRDLVVAQAEQPYRANSVPPTRADPRADLRDEARTPARAKAAPPVDRPEPEPAVVLAGVAPPAPTLGEVGAAQRVSSAPASPVVAVNGPPASPPPVAAAERRVVLAAPPATAAAVAAVAAPPVMAAAVPAASPPGDTVVAAADAAHRVEVSGGVTGARFGSDAVRGSLDQAKKAVPAPADKLVVASLAALPTPLHAAAANGDVDTLHKLLANPATRVDLVDAQGRTPLMLAVAGQHVGAVRVLLAAGADPDRADPGGATPRSVARSGANPEIAALLAPPR